jgi:hypothetical protein
VPFSVIGVLDRKGQAASGRSQDDIVIVPLAIARIRRDTPLPPSPSPAAILSDI